MVADIEPVDISYQGREGRKTRVRWEFAIQADDESLPDWVPLAGPDGDCCYWPATSAEKARKLALHMLDIERDKQITRLRRRVKAAQLELDRLLAL